MQQTTLVEQLEKEAKNLNAELIKHREQREFHARKESEKERALRSLMETIDVLKARLGSSENELEKSVTIPYSQEPLVLAGGKEGYGNLISTRHGNNETTPTPMPDELRRPDWKYMNLGQILESLCPQMQQPFTRDDLIPKIYDTNGEEEWAACGRSMNAALSRAVQSGFLVREGRGSFAVKNQKIQPILEVYKQSGMVENMSQ